MYIVRCAVPGTCSLDRSEPFRWQLASDDNARASKYCGLKSPTFSQGKGGGQKVSVLDLLTIPFFVCGCSKGSPH